MRLQPAALNSNAPLNAPNRMTLRVDNRRPNSNINNTIPTIHPVLVPELLQPAPPVVMTLNETVPVWPLPVTVAINLMDAP